MRTVASSLSRAGLVIVAACSFAASARASGPVERLLQALPHPTDPNAFVVRYGVPAGASNGFLFSSDGGKTFKAGCSSMIAPNLKLQRSSSPYLATVTLDSAGKLLVAQNQNEFFAGDGTGCSYTKVPGFENRTVQALVPDPTDPAALFALTYFRDPAKSSFTVSEVMRRDAAGAWSVVGPVRPGSTEQVFASELLVGKQAAGGLRMVSYYSAVGITDAGVTDDYYMSVSEDGGKTWKEYATEKPGDDYFFRLITLDPTNPDRVLGLMFGEGVQDELLLSSDKGATFKPWTKLDEFSGATFGADGRVFIGDGADAIEGSMGGVFTATALGEPLTKLGSAPYIDCIQYRALDQKLFACQRDKFGTIDPASGTFTELVRIEKVPALLDCPNSDVSATCKDQLNSGLSWCCAGHYPCTEFCSQYDVTSSKSGPVLCGRSGRAYDEDVGKMCGGDAPPADAGTSKSDAGVTTKLDAGSSTPTPTKKDASTSSPDAARANDSAEKDDDGCSVKAPGANRESTGITLASLGLLLVSLGRALRRRSRR